MRLDADYNGWWMCLIPTSILREIGLSLPAFIKWDDAEFCVRARDAGYPTVSVPGVALWHVSWLGKDDSIDCRRTSTPATASSRPCCTRAPPRAERSSATADASTSST